MQKRTERKLLLGILVSILIVVAIFLAYSFGDFKPTPLALASLDSGVGQCSGGFTSFSIDRITINSDKSRIRVYGVAKGSECLNIRLTQSQLNSALNGEGVQATRDVVGEIRLKEYTKTFPIDRIVQSSQQQVYKSIETANIGKLVYCSLSNCREEASETTFDTYRDLYLNCICAYTGSNGFAGDFSSARSYGNFKVDFTIDGKTATLTREQQSVNIGNHHIEWVGNLMNLDQIYPPQYDARLIESKWGLVQDGALGMIENRFQEFKNCFVYGWEGGLTSPTKFANCKSVFISNSNTILSDKLSLYKSQNSVLIYDAETDNNNLYVSLKATPYPTFILDLDAEDVGIIALEGDPKITSCIPNQPSLKSGQNTVVSFKVKNDANVDNVEFYGSIECNQGIVGFFSNFNIDGFQEKTIVTELIPSNPQQSDLTVSCTVKVNDLKSGNFDTCGFIGVIKYESGIICEPNSLTCDVSYENLLQCTSDGKNKIIKEECEFGCEITTTGAKCRGEIEPSNYCESCDAYARNLIFGKLFKSQECLKKTFQGSFFCIFAILKLFAVPFIFIFSLVFGIQIFNKLLKGKYLWLVWLLGIVISLLIAWLTYILFWWGVVLIIIYGIFRGVLSFIPGLNIKKKKR